MRERKVSKMFTSLNYWLKNPAHPLMITMATILISFAVTGINLLCFSEKRTLASGFWYACSMNPCEVISNFLIVSGEIISLVFSIIGITNYREAIRNKEKNSFLFMTLMFLCMIISLAWSILLILILQSMSL